MRSEDQIRQRALELGSMRAALVPTRVVLGHTDKGGVAYWEADNWHNARALESVNGELAALRWALDDWDG